MNQTINRLTSHLLRSRIPYHHQHAQVRRLFDFKKLTKNLAKGMTVKSVTISSGILAAYGLTYLYLKREKELNKKRQRMESLKKTIGGAFNLTDHRGKPFGSDELTGRWSLLYFGFTHCPDICPDELEKIAEVVDKLSSRKDVPEVVPLFITVDPARDDPPSIAKYLADFSPKMIGLTGSQEAINKVCQLFRVYSHAGIPDEHNEYIVDHTIVTYLINPEGEFVDYYMRSNTSDQIVNAVIRHIEDYNVLNKKKFWLIS